MICIAQAAAHAADRKEAEGDIAALRRLAKARGRALHRVRAMAHDVLRQRSEVEAFLVSSIRMVRNLTVPPSLIMLFVYIYPIFQS